MIERIKSFKLNQCENILSNEQLRNEIKWQENKERRIDEISKVISFASENKAGKKNYIIIYKNLRRLDFWKELYEAKYDDKGITFKSELKEASSKINDQTKTIKKYERWTKVNEKLPKGSYLACSIPINHWRLIHQKNLTI